MKKLLVTFSLLSLSLFSGAQTDLFHELKSSIKQQHPELNLEDKLIAYNVWSLENAESRELNKAFEKTYGVYEHAKLKGGSKGIVVVAINSDNLSPEAVITASRDGITKTISVKLSEVREVGPAGSNAVFDSTGQEVYKNLASTAVLESVHKLITR